MSAAQRRAWVGRDCLKNSYVFMGLGSVAENRTLNILETMTAEQKIEWLNDRDPIHVWAVDSDVFCLHCDGMFKAQDVACDGDNEPTCPVCKGSSVIDFHGIPWWRDDLVADDDGYEWRLVRFAAIAGCPGRLPRQKDEKRRCIICGVSVSQCCC